MGAFGPTGGLWPLLVCGGVQTEQNSTIFWLGGNEQNNINYFLGGGVQTELEGILL